MTFKQGGRTCAVGQDGLEGSWEESGQHRHQALTTEMSLLGCHLCGHCCKEAQLLSLVGYSPHCTSNFYIPNFKASVGHSTRNVFNFLIFFFNLVFLTLVLGKAKTLTFL